MLCDMIVTATLSANHSFGMLFAESGVNLRHTGFTETLLQSHPECVAEENK